MAALPSSSAALLNDSISQSRKRRHSALEFLTITPTVPGLEQVKRPRILIVDDDENEQDFPQGSATTAEALDSSSPSVEDSSDTDSTSSAGESSSGEESDYMSVGSGSPAPADAEGWLPTVDEEGEEADGESGTSPSSSSSESDGEHLQYSTPNPGVNLDPSHITLSPSPHLGSTASSPSPSISIQRNALHSRLQAFLPKLHAANTHLDEMRDAGMLGEYNIELTSGDGERMDADADADADDELDGDGVPYIEMNLGLGVLEERLGDESDSSSSSSESSFEGDDGTGGLALDEDGTTVQGKERQALRKLMGEGKALRPEICILEDG